MGSLEPIITLHGEKLTIHCEEHAEVINTASTVITSSDSQESNEHESLNTSAMTEVEYPQKQASKDKDFAILKLQLETSRQQAIEAECKAQVLRVTLEDQLRRFADCQCAMAAALDKKAKDETDAVLRAQRLELAVTTALATIQASLSQHVEEDMAYSQLRRAERAEATLKAAEVLLRSTLPQSQLSCSAQVDLRHIACRLDRLEALLEKSQQPSQFIKDVGSASNGEPTQGGTPRHGFKRDSILIKALTPPSGSCSGSGTLPSAMWMTPREIPSPTKASRYENLSSKPVWDGQYLSSPKKARHPGGFNLELEAFSPVRRKCGVDSSLDGQLPEVAVQVGNAAASTFHDDGLPLPPSSRCWDWPLSRPEKVERVAMIDAQILLSDHRDLVGQVEVLRDVCVQHGIIPSKTASS